MYNLHDANKVVVSNVFFKKKKKTVRGARVHPDTETGACFTAPRVPRVLRTKCELIKVTALWGAVKIMTK